MPDHQGKHDATQGSNVCWGAVALLVEDLGADVVWIVDCSEMRELSKHQNPASPNSPFLLQAQSGGEVEVSNLDCHVVGEEEVF